SISSSEPWHSLNRQSFIRLTSSCRVRQLLGVKTHSGKRKRSSLPNLRKLTSRISYLLMEETFQSGTSGQEEPPGVLAADAQARHRHLQLQVRSSIEPGQSSV